MNQQNSDNPNINEWDSFCAALMFYTRLPVPSNTPHSQAILNNSRKFFPFIGIIIGSIAVLVFLISHEFLPLSVSVALSMIASILATGAFHEDGFADSCDGLGGGLQKEHVLSIMKDSRLGTYAAIGLIGILSIKFLTLFELSQLSLQAFIFCLIAGHTLSRLISSLVIDFYDYVQDIDQSKVKPITDSGLSSADKHASFIISAIPILLLAFTALIPTLVVARYVDTHYSPYYTRDREWDLLRTD